MMNNENDISVEISKKQNLIKEISNKINDLKLVKAKLEVQLKYENNPNTDITCKKIKNIDSEINILKLNLMKNQVDIANLKCERLQNMNKNFNFSYTQTYIETKQNDLNDKVSTELLQKMDDLLELSKIRIKTEENSSEYRGKSYLETRGKIEEDYENLLNLYNQSLVKIQYLTMENSKLKEDLKTIQNQLTEVSNTNAREVNEIKSIIKVLQDKNRGYAQFEEELDKIIYDSCLTLKDLETLDKTENEDDLILNEGHNYANVNLTYNNIGHYKISDNKYVNENNKQNASMYQYTPNYNFSYENKLRLNQIFNLTKKLKGLLEDNKKLSDEIDMIKNFDDDTMGAVDNSVEAGGLNISENSHEKINKLNTLVDKITMQQKDILES